MRFLFYAWVALAAASAHAADRHIDLIANTPCLEEYRLWVFSARRTSTFEVPSDFTREQCDRAKELHEAIQAELFDEHQQRAERVARESAAEEAERRAARQAALVAMADAFVARSKLPRPRLGMTRQQVIEGTNWGSPLDVNRTTTAAGVTEQWVYGSKRYLYFRNGRLDGIQD